jgi:asparagine synthase (glutamine-hydrolysing)
MPMTQEYALMKPSQTLLPAEIVNRKKQGFPVPISLWFRGEARSFVRDHLSPSALRGRGLFNVEYVEKLLSQHERGLADHGSRIWALLDVELWHSLFIDAQPRPLPAGSRGIMPNSAQAGRREGRQ